MKSIDYYFDKVDDVILDKSLKIEYGSSISKIRDELIENFQFQKDADYYYLLGYIGYNFKSIYSISDTLSLFEKSLELDSQNYFCRYYYSFLLFDLDRFQDAFKNFHLIDISFFSDFQDWRRLKIEEMILVCSMLLKFKSDEKIDEDISNWLIEYNEWTDQSDDFNYPIDLINFLFQEAKKGRSLKKSTQLLIKTIEKFDLQEDYKCEIEYFKQN